MKIQHLTSKNRELYAKLYRYAFQSIDNNYENLKFPDKDIPNDWIYGVFDKTNLICGALLIDFDIFLRGSLLKMGGVAGVATRPENRNRGAVRLLMNRLFKEMYEHNVPISMLYPFKFSYWGKFGYRLCDESVLYQVKLENIKKSEIEGRYVREVKGINKDIKSVYAAITQKYNLMVRRKKLQWKWKNGSGFPFVCYNEQDRPTGYLILKFFKDEYVSYTTYIKKLAMTVVVQEMFWLDQLTKETMLSFLWSHRDHRKYTAFSLPIDEPVVDFLLEPRIEMRITRPNSMFRVIDAKTVLEKIAYPILDFRFSVQIRDPMCPWNHGCFGVSSAKGKVAVEKLKSIRADLELKIQDFSQLVSGFRTIYQLMERRSAIVKNKKQEIFAQLFPPRTNFLRDFF